MGLFDKFKRSKEKEIILSKYQSFNDVFENLQIFINKKCQLMIDKYAEQLNKVENQFYEYKTNTETIISKVSETIDHTIITNGAITNFIPFNEERLGYKLNGKIINNPIVSNHCMKYHYDSNDKLVMVEEYSTFLNKFMITEIYLYYDNYAEKLWFSNGLLGRLFVFDNPFANTKLCLSFSSHIQGGKVVEEFIYEDNKLKEINIGRTEGNYKDICIYEKDKLIMIEKIYPNGNRGLCYTTKKPNFKKIRADIETNLKRIIREQSEEYTAFGIEGFLDQQKPNIYVCFTKEEKPSDLIADWNVTMNEIEVYNWQFNEEQEKKCVKMIAEIIISLVDEQILNNKQIYFHQNQVCVSQLYIGAKNVFKKNNLIVK